MAGEVDTLMHESSSKDEPTFADMEREMTGAEPGAEQQAEGSETTAPPAPQQPVEAPMLKAERERRQAAEASRRELEAELKAERTRLTEFMESMKPRQAPVQVATPDVNADPVGYFKAQTEALRRELEEVKGTAGQFTQQQQQSAQQTQFVTRYRADAQAFTKAQPDFTAAYNHIIEAFKGDYEDAGYEPAEVGQLLVALESELANRAWKQGANPAERIYKMAVKRGYKAANAAQAAATIETIERGRAQASSPLSGSNGAASPHAGMTPERLQKMSASEYARVPKEIRMRALQGKL